MAIASGSGRRIAFVPEVTFGVTPETPTFQVLRAIGGGPRTNKTTGTSDELQIDGNIRDEFEMGQDVAGAYELEFSYGSFDPLLEALMGGAWTANVLKNGTAPKSFTFEETLELGATDSFSRFVGCMMNSFSLSIAARAKITASLNLMGKSEALATAIIAGATYTAAGTAPILTGSVDVAAMSFPGGGTPIVRSLSLELNTGLRTRPKVASKFSEEFGRGRFSVTGTAEIYFESNTLYQAVLDHGGGVLAFTIGRDANKKYTFDMPKIIFGNGERRPGGNDDDVMVSLPFRAVYDATEDCTLKITRAVA